jgi:fatty acid desaturase
MALPIPAETLKTLSIRSDLKGGFQLACHMGLIALAVTLVLAVRHTLWLLPAMALLGVLEVALFTPLHETTHRTPFRARWLNRAVGIVAGFVLVLPPEWFRYFHLAHHRHTQDPARDPELMGAPPLTRRRYWLKLSGLPYWQGEIRMLIATALGRADDYWIPRSERAAVIREARLYLAAYALLILWAVAAGSVLPLILWAVPVVLGQPALRAVLLAEHTGCPLGDDGFANTRTTLAGRLLRLVFWNANYHAEHHLAPSVPFHALPRLHEEVKARLGRIDAGYPAAHQGIRAGLAS